MIIDEELMSDVQAVISGASHALARDYRLYTPAQDIAQEMWVWCVKHPGKISDYLDREEKGDRLRGMKALNKTLMRLGVAYCRREKAALSGYHPSDEYFYTRSLIGALLEAIWNDSTLVVNVIDDMPKRKKLDSEGNDLLAMMCDVERAMSVLDGNQVDLLMQIHVDNISVIDLAERDGVTRQAVENRVNRALDKMITFLGGEYPY